MIFAAVLMAGALQQDLGQQVAELVAEAEYSEAIELAGQASGAEAAWLEAWVRHQAGDLTGALGCAEAGLESAPEDVRLLNEASYLCVSLARGEAALAYAERLSAAGGEQAAARLEEARELNARTDAVERSMSTAWLLIALSAAAGLGVAAYGLGAASGQPD